MAFSMFSLERFAAFAFWMATRRDAFESGSGPPDFAASVMDRDSLGKTLDIVAQRDSLARLLHSNALPMAFDQLVTRIGMST
jgi:hypothetical protein